MEVLIEEIAIYGGVALFVIVIVSIYVRKLKRESDVVSEKIKISKLEGLHEPVSLHPVVDVNSCIKTEACIMACPEKDILGVHNGKATIINASRCVGHGACFHACPTEAITLCIGTEKRGVDLPHVNQEFESNVQGIYVAGELGGMGLIKNAVEQGKQAAENLIRTLDRNNKNDYELVIVGAGPAGISASLTAKKHRIKFLTLDQDSLGGTVYTFPRAKIVMTSAMNLPLHGKVRLQETSKPELLELWESVLSKNKITIQENTKIEAIQKQEQGFLINTNKGQSIRTQKVLLAIGRRGTPRKLNIPGENSTNVAYRLLEPELISGKNIIVVGGGDSAIESALLLADQNKVMLSYRRDSFGRLKQKNSDKIKAAMADSSIDVIFNSNLESIEDGFVYLKTQDKVSPQKIDCHQVYIFAGGELPTEFLKKSGITITTKFGEAILKH